MAGRLPYFGKSYAVDDAREIVKEQMKRNTQQQISTDRTHASLQRTAMLPQVEIAKARAMGDIALDNARRYKEAGFEVSTSGKPTTYKPGAGRGGGTASSSKAAAEYKRGLVDAGMTNPYALAATMGHAEIESGGFNPTARGDKMGGVHTAFGMNQWRGSRWVGLRKFAQAEGGDPADPYIQGKYVVHEMRTTERAAGAKVLNARSLEEGHQGMLQYERPDTDPKTGRKYHDAERRAKTAAWYKKGTAIKPDENFTGGGSSTGGLVEVTLPDGRKAKGVYANNADLRTIIENDRKLARRLKARPEAGTEKGRFFYEILPDPNAAPATQVAGATPPTVAAPAAPATQPKPTNAEPAVVPITPAPVSIEDDDDDDDDTVDPYTGM